MIKGLIQWIHFKKNNIKVWKPANVYHTAKIGKNVSIGMFSEIGNNVVVGEGTRIGMGVFIPEGVTIGRNCFIGPKVTFSNDRYPPSHRWQWQKTVIEDDVALGAGVCLRPGVTVKQGSLIGMGAVVTYDIPGGEIWAGNPARFIREIKDDCEFVVPKAE